jgi:hypothetical protein
MSRRAQHGGCPQRAPPCGRAGAVERRLELPSHDPPETVGGGAAGVVGPGAAGWADRGAAGGVDRGAAGGVDRGADGGADGGESRSRARCLCPDLPRRTAPR